MLQLNGLSEVSSNGGMAQDVRKMLTRVTWLKSPMLALWNAFSSQPLPPPCSLNPSSQRLCAPDFVQVENTLAPDAYVKVSFYVLKKWPGLSPPMALKHATANNALTTPRCALQWRALAFPGGLRPHSSVHCCRRWTVSWAALSGRIIVLCQIRSPSRQRMLIQGFFFLLCAIHPAAGFLIRLLLYDAQRNKRSTFSFFSEQPLF